MVSSAGVAPPHSGARGSRLRAGRTPRGEAIAGRLAPTPRPRPENLTRPVDDRLFFAAEASTRWKPSPSRTEHDGRREDRLMFVIHTEVPSGAELLAELGPDVRAIRHILDEPAAFDPRGDEAE